MLTTISYSMAINQKLGVKDALVIVAISYYLSGNVRDLHASYRRNKSNMTKEALNVMHMMVSSKDPVAIMEAGLKEILTE